ncbi:hypothetical protein ACRAWD_18650 [Caulobacter segnis]
MRNRFVRYSDGLQSNWGARNYIGANTFEGNAFGVSLTGAGNMVEGSHDPRQRDRRRRAPGSQGRRQPHQPEQHFRQRPADPALLGRRLVRSRSWPGRRRSSARRAWSTASFRRLARHGRMRVST